MVFSILLGVQPGPSALENPRAMATKRGTQQQGHWWRGRMQWFSLSFFSVFFAGARLAAQIMSRRPIPIPLVAV